MEVKGLLVSVSSLLGSVAPRDQTQVIQLGAQSPVPAEPSNQPQF